MKRTVLLLMLWFDCLCFTPCGAETTVQKQRLDNGLTVILKEIHTSPIVALQLWVKVGSADETEDEAGITHLIEHMLFKGTTRRQVGEIAREIESAGGEINASTSYDQTVFYIAIPSRTFLTGLSVLADAIQNSSFDSTELEREKQVVLEEIRMRTDQPAVKLNEAVFKAAYTAHPYGRPIIGFEKTVTSFTRGKVIAYFKKWYVPENMSLVVSGDVRSGETLTAIKESFKDFSSPLTVVSRRVPEPHQTEIRSTVLRGEVNKAYLMMAFHIPAISNDDIHALDVLACILGGGNASRLYQRIKSRRELAYSISAYTYTPKEPGLFVILANVEVDKTRPALSGIMREIYALQDEPASSDELQRAKIGLESEFVYGKETMEGEAEQLGHFETLLGDVAYEQTYLARINQVSAPDISRVTSTYLVPENLTVGLLIPEGSTSLTPEVLREAAKGVTRPAVAFSDVQPQPTRYILPNGMTVVVNENHRLPLVAMKAVYLGGVRFEEEKNNGINNFVAGMLTKGTKNRSALQIAEEIESMAGELNGFSGRNSFGVSCTVLRQFFEKGLELFADVLLNPSFPSDEVEKKRADILAAIARRKDHPVSFTIKEFDTLFFGNHPYGMDTLGNKDAIKGMRGVDLEGYYNSLAHPQNLVLVISGDVDSPRLKEKVASVFQGFRGGEPSYPTVPKTTTPEMIQKKEVIKGKRTQAHIMLGFPGVDVMSPDKYALQVLTTILAGQGGRLFAELRDKQSLAYALSPIEWEGLDPGYIAFYLGCAPSKVGQAVGGILGEMQKMREEKPTPQEFTRAQNYILGSFSVEHQTNESQALDMALNERYGLGYGYSQTYLNEILRVTGEDVQRVAKKYLTLERYTLLTVIPEEAGSIQ